jgi:hypothetical protein
MVGCVVNDMVEQRQDQDEGKLAVDVINDFVFARLCQSNLGLET